MARFWSGVFHRAACFNSNSSLRSLPKWHRCQHSVASNAELAVEPEYPPIKPKLPPGRWGEVYQKKPYLAWKMYEKGQDLLKINNVKERLEKMTGSENKEKHFMHVIPDFDAHPQNLLHKQYITKTHLVEGLPEVYDSINIDDQLLEKAVSLVEQSILLESDIHLKYQTDNEQAARLPNFVTKCDEKEMSQRELYAHSILDACLRNLFVVATGLNNPHLLRSQVDEDVRVESFWSRGGFEKSTQGQWFNAANFQYLGNAAFQIRTEQPLPEFVDIDDSLCQEGKYPSTYNYDPKCFGMLASRRQPVSVSGHWISDPCEFGLVSFLLPGQSFDQFKSDHSERWEGVHEEQMQTSAVIHGFGSCTAQAHNQGFNSFLPLTYPFSTQTVIFDGKNILFSAYQLNTLDLAQDDEAVPERNVAWVSQALQLYDTIEGGKVKGINKFALRLFLKFLSMKPVDRGIDLRPYLPNEDAPVEKQQFINNVGEEPLPQSKIGRWQHPRNAVYF